jgi:hypothetical protein
MSDAHDRHPDEGADLHAELHADQQRSLDDLLGERDPTVLHGDRGRGSGRHLVNVAHLVMGIAFLGIVGIWLLVQGDVVGGDDVRWLLPLPWVLGGLAGLLSIATAGRRRRAG